MTTAIDLQCCLSNFAAMRAIEVKNHSPLLGRMIRVAWSIRDPDARKNWKANVFVKVASDLYIFIWGRFNG